MTLLISSQPVPLQTDADGVVRVSGTRVTLDTIVAAFQNGSAAEEIGLQYPTVPLADIYDVIAYYLRNKAAVEAYLRAQESSAEATRVEWEARGNMRELRQKLQTRHQN